MTDRRFKRNDLVRVRADAKCVGRRGQVGRFQRYDRMSSRSHHTALINIAIVQFNRAEFQPDEWMDPDDIEPAPAIDALGSLVDDPWVEA